MRVLIGLVAILGATEARGQPADPSSSSSATAAATATASGGSAEAALDDVTSPPPEPPRAEGNWLEDLGPEDPMVELVHDPFRLAPHALLQVAAVPYVGRDGRIAAGDPANVEGFVLRRARLGLDGTFVRDVRWSVWLEFHDSTGEEGDAGQAQLLDASLTWEAHRLAVVSAGVGKVPFSKAWTTSAALLQLAERPFALRQLDVRPIVPDRQLGAWLTGDLEIAAWALGVFNGSEGLGEGDDNGGLLYAARLEVTPLGPTGTTQTAFFPGEEGYDRIRVAVGGGAYFNDDAAGDQLAFGVDLTAKWKRLSLTAELLQSTWEPDDAPVVPDDGFARRDQRGIYGQAGFFVLPGRLELVARVEALDRNLDAEDGTAVTAYTAGANWYFLRHRLKVMGAFVRRREPDVSPAGQDRNSSATFLLQGAF